jgi:ABC-type nitrate/sulfonate/bicarbonate transport system ATPase subunit/ABC-type nitrate/sulfonate/bicarbonate transport system permease component
MKKNITIPTLLAILFIGIVWQLISMQIGFSALFPSLFDLLKQVFTLFLSDNFLITVSTTVLRGTFGFLIAFIFAFILAAIATFSEFWNAFFHPIIVTTRSIPVISFVLIAILWFSPPYLPVFIAVITMLPILYQNTLTGFQNTDKKWIEMAKVFGRTSFQRFISIYLPASKKIIFDGISTAMGFGWRAVIIGEVLAQPIHGIGTSMKQAQAFINVSELIAWTIVAVGVSYFFEAIIRQIKKFHVGIQLPLPALYQHKQDNKSIHSKSIKIDNINKSFNTKSIIHSFSNDFDDRTISCVKGPSGRGKTTLLRMIAQLEKPDSGIIIYPKLSQMAFSFQDIRLFPWLTVSENIAYGVYPKPLFAQETSNLVGYLLKELELTHEAFKYPHQLSGGQQQRVGLARALAARSDILLLDEPLNGLDNALKNRVIEFLSEWIAAYRPVVVWATHENIKTKNMLIREVNL